MPSRLDLLSAGAPDQPRLSAYSLGVYQDCARKYALRYRQNRYWPASEGREEDERDARSLERGQHFHALVQAHQEGMPTAPILAALTAEDPAMESLWQAFLAHPDSRPLGAVWSEVSLHFFVKGVPAMARFDRLVRHDGHWIIQDWKTGGSPERLATSWQSKLYPFALAHAGHVLNDGESIPPAAITLRYWIWRGGQVEVLTMAYSAEQYAADLATFEQQASTLSAPLDAAHFPGHGPESRTCGRCAFMTLCHPVVLPEPPATALPLPRFSGPQAHEEGNP